ncbi:DUF3868 domain-containing protein [Parabacteroides sp. PF5-9]|uniref:DUF3868 domain-containing protein n=1 Tax=Parabacteroides sp. PF5-9 TaxID=1742404 RepID=UPI0024746063|nr:DUF3868 domain-containing protein [Parabacteroides sp. PF5-9]MDH6358640.1 outer membrane protein OmpA-like peptidoglycan-associated protein [Parabacteroides sp. PF5-9]
MKKINIYIIALLSMLAFGTLSAQNAYEGDLLFENIKAARQDNQLLMDVTINISGIELGKQHMIELTPMLRSSNQTRNLIFEPIMIVGTTRHKAIQRSINLGNYRFPVEPQQYIIKFKDETQRASVKLRVPYEEWMRDSELIFAEVVSGCADCDLGKAEHIAAAIAFGVPAPVKAEYELLYVTPDVEPVKNRDETHSAHLNYMVAKYDLIRNFQNNAAVLEEVDRIIRDVRNNSDLNVQSFTVTGYASPEGNYNSNMMLSQNRAYSFVNYLSRTHGISQNMIRVDWRGEDWEGLRRAVENSYIQDRDAILRIIDYTGNPETRKRQLKALSGGTTYRYLLNSLYPPLRRNDYTIAYTVRSFDLEEAKKMIRTRPHYLSLNEMFLVANTYPKGSREFKEIFDIAVKVFPDDPVANINAAAQDIEYEAYDSAINRLQGINQPEAWNNLGVAYARKGDYARAQEYLQLAADSGNRIAMANLNQLKASQPRR